MGLAVNADPVKINATIFERVFASSEEDEGSTIEGTPQNNGKLVEDSSEEGLTENDLIKIEHDLSKEFTASQIMQILEFLQGFSVDATSVDRTNAVVSKANNIFNELELKKNK